MKLNNVHQVVADAPAFRAAAYEFAAQSRCDEDSIYHSERTHSKEGSVPAQYPAVVSFYWHAIAGFTALCFRSYGVEDYAQLLRDTIADSTAQLAVLETR